MFDFFVRLFDTEGFPARWNCGIVWQEEPALGWLHVFSDLAIFGAYTAIPAVIAFFVLRRRDDIPFPKIFWLFVIFIFACGTTHLIGAIIFWSPIYRFDGLVKLITAIVSWSTVAALVVAAPQALRLPGLAKLNDELSREVDERRNTEAALRESERRLQENEEQLRQALSDREMLLASERNARSEAERANRIKDEFLSIVSHELRTPLSAMLGYVQVLQTGQVPEGEVRECHQAIERNGRAQVQIIDDLLDMSRIIAGKIRLNVHVVQLSEAIGPAMDSIRPAAEAKGIRLQQLLDPQAAPVLGDVDRLQQVFRNLLSNAVKFTPSGGQIRMAVERVKSHVEISVSDTGVGIRPDFLPHVFDRFRQGEHSTTRSHGGLGLGLAIVKQIVELHGGIVTATSPGENQGATFTVCLPLQDVQEGEANRVRPQIDVDASQVLELPNLNGLRVLVVDDEPDARDVVRRLITLQGADVATASSADEAVGVLTSFEPDVLVSDIGMPTKDGYQLIKEIRSLSDGQSEVPAVALTAFARTEDRRRALLAGYQSHLAKPVDPGELIAVIAMLSGRRPNQ